MPVSSDDYFVIIGVVFILLSLITFFFSSITMLIIIINWKSQCRSLNNLFACNSAVSILFYTIGITIQIPFLFQIDQQENDRNFCQIRAFIYVSACAVKCLSYLVQAISRWFITVHYRHRILLKFRTNIFMILISWIVAFVTSGCLLFSSQAYQYEPESRLCVLTSKVFLTSFVPSLFIFFIPACTITVLYGIILRHTTYTHRIHPKGLTKIANKRNIQVYRNILILLGIVITGGTPYLISVIINGIGEAPWIIYSLAVIFIGMAAAMESSAVFFTNHEVRKLFWKKIGCNRTRKIAAIA